MRILAAVGPGEIRLAAMDGGTLENFSLWRPGAPDGLGDVFHARIIARMPAMAGAFVGLPNAEGFLPDSAGAAGRTEGEMLAVRITRTAQGGKGPRLEAVSESASGPIGLLRRGPTPLDRLASFYTGASIEIDDPTLFARLRPAFADRLTLRPRLLDDALETQFEALTTREVALPGGLTATITPTPALTAIDMDGGASSAARAGKAATQLAANRQALPALIRQIRLRNLSGAILIDLAGIAVKRRASLAPDLSACLAADPARPRLLGFTQLGLAEILRPRHAPPLHELLEGPLAAGLLALRQCALQPNHRLALRASPPVIAALQADPDALADLARRAVYPLILRLDPALQNNGWVIEEHK